MQNWINITKEIGNGNGKTNFHIKLISKFKMKKLMNALKAFISRPFLDTFYRKKKSNLLL